MADSSEVHSVIRSPSGSASAAEASHASGHHSSIAPFPGESLAAIPALPSTEGVDHVDPDAHEIATAATSTSTPGLTTLRCTLPFSGAPTPDAPAGALAAPEDSPQTKASTDYLPKTVATRRQLSSSTASSASTGDDPDFPYEGGFPKIIKHHFPEAKWTPFFDALYFGSREWLDKIKPPVLPPQAVTPASAATFLAMFPQIDDTVPEIDDTDKEEDRPPKHSTGLESKSAETSSKALESVSDGASSKSDFSIVYEPHGKWKFLKDKPLKNVKELQFLGRGSMCSAHIKSATVELDDGTEKEFKYISRSWDTQKQSQWRGFFSELALYASSDYLRSLQGKVIPHLMGLYISPGKVTLAFEPPHHIFWIEASPTMPKVLKELVIDAFVKLHARGIVHGDIALRHILIGADCRVTIIDLQESAADVPNDDIGLLKMEPAEKELEMRRVMFTLDYEGARQKEFMKALGVMARETTMDVRAEQRRMREAAGEPTDDILDPPVPQEDIDVPPIDAEILEKIWMLNADAKPSRITMPGVHEYVVALAVEEFLHKVRMLENPLSPIYAAPSEKPDHSSSWSIASNVSGGYQHAPDEGGSAAGKVYAEPRPSVEEKVEDEAHRALSPASNKGKGKRKRVDNDSGDEAGGIKKARLSASRETHGARHECAVDEPGSSKRTEERLSGGQMGQPAASSSRLSGPTAAPLSREASPSPASADISGESDDAEHRACVDLASASPTASAIVAFPVPVSVVHITSDIATPPPATVSISAALPAPAIAEIDASEEFVPLFPAASVVVESISAQLRASVTLPVSPPEAVEGAPQAPVAEGAPGSPFATSSSSSSSPSSSSSSRDSTPSSKRSRSREDEDEDDESRPKRHRGSRERSPAHVAGSPIVRPRIKVRSFPRPRGPRLPSVTPEEGPRVPIVPALDRAMPLSLSEGGDDTPPAAQLFAIEDPEVAIQILLPEDLTPSPTATTISVGSP